MSQVFIQNGCMSTAERNTETLVRDHHHWMGILLILVSKNAIKITLLANCCVGGAEPVMGRGDMLWDKMWNSDFITLNLPGWAA